MIKTSDTAAGDIVEISLPTGGPYGIVFAADTDGYDCIIICLNASKSISFLQILPTISSFTRLMSISSSIKTVDECMYLSLH